MKSNYDILIAGAGPAGLMLAADLSKDFDVLVVEKEKAGTTTRAWCTFQDRINANKLQEAVVATPSKLTFHVDDEYNITYHDKHVLVDENKVLNIFKKRAEANGAQIKSYTSVRDFKYKGKNIVLKTNKGDYEGRLLIDCMGVTSPIVAKRKLQKNFNIWTIYGVRMKATKFPHPDTIGFYRIDQKYNPKGDDSNYMFGIYPKSKNHGDVYLFNVYNKIKQPEILKNIFNKSVKDFFPRFKSDGVVRGWIYNGDLKRYALNNVLFIGDSGGLTPQMISMGFNENLMKHRLISERIRHTLRHSADLNSKVLGDILLDDRISLSRTFLRIVQMATFYGNSSEGWKEGGIGVLKRGGKVFTRKLMRNELDIPLMRKGIRSLIDAVGFSGLLKMMPLTELIALSKDAAKILGDSAIEEAHLLHHKQHGDKPCKFCKK